MYCLKFDGIRDNQIKIISAVSSNHSRTVRVIPIKFYVTSCFPHHARRQTMSCVPKERGGINIFVGEGADMEAQISMFMLI